jgi:hypothetical protein
MCWIAGVAEQRAEKFAIVGKDVELGMQQHYESVAKRAAAGQLPFCYGPVLALYTLVVRHYKRFLAGKVVIGRAEGATCGFGNVAHCGLVESYFAEESDSGSQNVIASRVAEARLLGGLEWIHAQIFQSLGLNMFKMRLRRRVVKAFLNVFNFA